MFTNSNFPTTTYEIFPMTSLGSSKSTPRNKLNSREHQINLVKESIHQIEEKKQEIEKQSERSDISELEKVAFIKEKTVDIKRHFNQINSSLNFSYVKKHSEIRKQVEEIVKKIEGEISNKDPGLASVIKHIKSVLNLKEANCNKNTKGVSNHSIKKTKKS